MFFKHQRRRIACLGAAVVVGAAVLTACGGSSAGSTGSGGKLRVEASFYPLQWIAQQVGGDRLSVDSLTKPGAEPHDLELTPKEVAKVQDADVVVYLSGFQPSVDEAVGNAADATMFDVKASAGLDLSYTPIEAGKRTSDEAGTTDPHFWLDPTRLAKVARALAKTLGEADLDHARQYDANASELVSELEKLDGEYRTVLDGCANKDLITSHNAFGYLARRYGLRQVGITGLTPDEEPSPADLGSVADFVEAHHVRTIYFETLVSPAIAEAVASETGTKADVLDPIEGLNKRSQGSDYLEVMRSNLANIAEDQPCP